MAGSGAVAIFNLMEDAATAEISRSQIWQWIHNEVRLEGGELVSAGYVKQLADEEVSKLPQSTDYTQAQNMFIETSVNDDYLEFLTLPAYEAMA